MALAEDGGEGGKVRAFKVDGAHGVALDCGLPCSGHGGEEGEAGLGEEGDDYCEEFGGKVKRHCGFLFGKESHPDEPGSYYIIVHIRTCLLSQWSCI